MTIKNVNNTFITESHYLNNSLSNNDKFAIPNSEYNWQMSQILFYVLTFIIGIIGNLLVIFVILMNRKLKTVTNMYLLHLAITDFIYLLSIPFAIVALVKHKWVFNLLLCKVFWLFNGIHQFTSIFIVTVLAFDRY